MKIDNIIMFVLCTIVGIFFVVVISGYSNEIKKLKLEIIEIKSKCDVLEQKNNSVLLMEYQEAYNILREKEPKAFDSFSKIMDSLDTR